MKKLLVLVAILEIVFWTAATNGQSSASSSTDVQSNQTQTTIVKGPGYAEGGDASAGASAGAGIYWDYSPTTVMRYPEYKVGLVQPGYPQPPWWMPGAPQIALWNAAAADLRFYEGWWTRKQVEQALKKSGKWFTEWGAGFESIVTLKSYDNKPTSSIELKLLQNATYELIQKDYTFLGDVPVKGRKDLTLFLTLMWALKLAMDNGADLAVLSGGMNTVYQGINFSPGLGFGTAGVHNSFSLVSGLASTEAKAQAEPVVQLAIFTANGTGISLPSTEEKKEKEVEVEEEKGKEIQGVPVSPGILSMAGFQKGMKQEAKKEKDQKEEVDPMIRSIWRRVAGG